MGKLCIRIQKVFPRILDLGSRPWIQEVFPRILDLGSWIQTLDPRSFSLNLGSWILDPDLGSKKFFLESWILDLGSRPWIQEVFPRILDLGSWIQISCYGSIALINVCKHHLKNHQKMPKKKVPKYAKNTVHTSKKCKNVGFFFGGGVPYISIFIYKYIYIYTIGKKGPVWNLILLQLLSWLLVLIAFIVLSLYLSRFLYLQIFRHP